MIALTTEPSWPGTSPPPVYQRRLSPSIARTSSTPAPVIPGVDQNAPG
jgi:hypothetical protein